MVKTATNLGRSGVQDWLIQRVTAIILAVSLLFLLGFLITHTPLQYESWRALFAKRWMPSVSLLALLSLIAHTWIGIWTIITDYIKPIAVRLFVQSAVLLLLMAEVVWGIRIMWDV